MDRSIDLMSRALKSVFKWQVVSLFVGSLLGAYLGYRFTVYQEGAETEAKRAALFRLLCSEYETMQSTNPRTRLPAPITLVAASQLLDGQTLSYLSHEELITTLLRLQYQVNLYNALVPRSRVPGKQTVVIGPGPATVGTDVLDTLRGDIIESWEAAHSLIPGCP